MVNEREPVVDIESSGSECEEDPRNEPVTGGERAKRVGTLSFEGCDEGEYSSNSNRSLVKTGDDEYCDIESLISSKFEVEKEEHTPLNGKTQTKEKHKTRNSKKPPRPHKGPSLNTSDLHLVREISELVMKKRARVERLKAMKKLRAARSPSSSKSSLFAMAVTFLFFIVIIFQGFSSGKSSTLRTSGLIPSHPLS